MSEMKEKLIKCLTDEELIDSMVNMMNDRKMENIEEYEKENVTPEYAE